MFVSQQRVLQVQAAAAQQQVTLLSQQHLSQKHQMDLEATLLAEREGKLEAQLSAHYEKASFETYSSTVSCIAHDIRAPLAALKSGMAGLHRNVNDNKTPPARVLELMDTALMVSLDFVETMKASAQCLQGGVAESLELEDVSVSQVVDEAILCFRHSLVPDVHFTATVPAELKDVQVLSSGRFIRRSLTNYLHNAARHTIEGEISLTVALQRTVSRRFYGRSSNVEVVFTVSDTGSGVSKEQQQTMWKPFISHASSTGLGLHTVRELCEALGGKCGYEPRPIGAEASDHLNAGSTFWFSIPYVPAAQSFAYSTSEAFIEERQDLKITPASVGHLIRLLVIDDDPSFRQLNALELESYGYHVDTAATPFEGEHCPSASQCVFDSHPYGRQQCTKVARIHPGAL